MSSQKLRSTTKMAVLHWAFQSRAAAIPAQPLVGRMTVAGFHLMLKSKAMFVALLGAEND
eukprot:5707060-Pleurochrysis_carterae.AAC.1